MKQPSASGKGQLEMKARKAYIIFYHLVFQARMMMPQ